LIGDETLIHWARHYFNSAVLIKNPLDPIYSASGNPNPPIGGMFSGADIINNKIAGSVDTPATAWALINMCRIYKLTKYAPAKVQINSIANYFVNHLITCDFYGSLFKAMPNAYTYQSGSFRAKTNIIHMRTFYHTAWALLEAYDITRNASYKESAEALLDGAATFFSNIKSAVDRHEISQWMDGAVFNGITSGDGISFEPTWTDFANTTLDVIYYSITKYLGLFGDASRVGGENIPYLVSDLLNKHTAWYSIAYASHGMRNITGKLIYCFYHYDWADPLAGDGSYTPIAQNWDFINDVWGATQWFTGDLEFWAINGMACSGMTSEATILLNEYYGIRTYIANVDEILFYDRYNADGSVFIADTSISITFTSLFYKLCNKLGVTTYNSRLLATLKTYMLNNPSAITDGGFSWDVSTPNQNLESKTLGEIIDATANDFVITDYSLTSIPNEKNIRLYEKSTTDFSNNGIGVLGDCISCIVTEELNGRLDLELIHPVDPRGKYKSLNGFNIVKAGGQLFRIDTPENIQDSGKSVKVHALHVFYDNNYGFIEDRRAEVKTASEALVIALQDNPSAIVGACDVTGTNTAYFVKNNPTESVFAILGRWGGELFRDNFTVALKNNIGSDNGVLVAFGKNILGFSQRLDFTGVATRIMPTGKDGCTIDLVNGGSKYLNSPLINNPAYPFVITREVKFPDLVDATELKNAGLALWGTIDIPATNYTVKFAELRKTTEYASLKALETVGIGDTVIIRHSVFGVDIRAEVIVTKKDVLMDKLVEVQLGNFRDNLGKTINNQNSAIANNAVAIASTNADVTATNTRVTQTNDAIVLQATRIDDAEGRLDTAELKITPDAITSTVTNSTTYINDLGEKVTSAQASTIAQTASNVKIGFNNISNVVDIDETGITVTHGGSDYTHMGVDGFKKHVGSTNKDYHYLGDGGVISIPLAWDGSLNSGSVTIQLPDAYRGKSFVVIPSVALTYSTIQYSMGYVGVQVTSYDYANAQVTLIGFYGNYSSGNAGGHLDASYIAVA